MFEKPFYVYAYEHVDNDSMMLSLEEYKKKFLPKEQYQSFDEQVEGIKIVWEKAGWEGDGEVRMVWIPPFCIKGYNTFGIFVYHVKQRNNGTSFIYSLEELESIKECEVDLFK